MKSNNFILRILTSLGLIAVLSLAWVGLPKAGMFFLVSFFVAVLIWEYYKLVFYKQFSKRIFGLFFLVVFGFYLFFMSPLFFSFLSQPRAGNKGFFLLSFYGLLVIGFWGFYLYQARLRKFEKLGLGLRGGSSRKDLIWQIGSVISEKKIFFGFLALFYIAFPAGWFLNVFFRREEHSNILLVILSLVFVGDIFAYMGGRILKGKKWVPFLSPKKTWSGLCCGLGGSAFTSGLGFSLINGSFSLFFLYFLFGAFGFLLAQTGDLFASLLKRRAGVKDSGSLLPGHGGVLDRLDGFLLAFPCVYFFVSGFV